MDTMDTKEHTGFTFVSFVSSVLTGSGSLLCL